MESQRPVIASFIFYYDAENKIFSCNISELGSIISELGLITSWRVSDGVGIRSQKTDEIANWELNKIHTNPDGDITHWEFKPTLASWTKFKNLGGCKVILFND